MTKPKTTKRYRHIPPLSDAFRARFVEQIDRRPQHADACWEWQGVRSPNGYGRADYYDSDLRLSVTTSAHRLAWAVITGTAPEPDQDVDHRCGNRLCCRPSHLRLMDHRGNVLRSATSPAAVNARKDVCINGHPITEGHPNVRLLRTARGVTRECITCANERAARYRQGRRERDNVGPRNAVKTHCANGHEYTEANTKIRRRPDGRTERECKTCIARQQIERRERKARNAS